MKTLVMAIGVVLFCLGSQVAWAQETESVPKQMSLTEFLKTGEDYGYSVTLDRKSGEHAVIYLEKHGKTDEGHGLLDIPWQMRETWKLEFYGNLDTLKLINKDGMVEEKAPWLGEWRPYKPKSSAVQLPPALQVPALKVRFVSWAPG